MNSAGDNFPHLDHFPSAAHGYPVIYLTDKDNVLCADCAKQVQEEGGKVSAHVYEEGPTHNCEICDAPLESAYGDPSEPDKDEKPTKDQEYNKMLLELDDNDTHDQVFI